MIPYGRHFIDEDDIQSVVDCLRSDFLTTGPKVQEFEKTLCEATTAKYAVACSNGTTALHLASIALGIGEGDNVIVPSLTFLATANAPRSAGANIIFSDVNPETGLMEAPHLEEAIQRCGDNKPKAVFPVHLTGQCADLKEIRNIADKHSIKVVADSCHALGGELYGHPIGAGEFEHMSTFSFHPVKTIAMGEGGAILTNDKKWADKMRLVRSHAMQKTPDVGPWAYEMNELGYNYRASDINCALGISQMKKLKSFTARRAELVAIYDALLEPLSPFVLSPVKNEYTNPAWHLYAVKIDFDAVEKTRSEVMTELMAEGVGTQVHYIPVHTQPYYKDLNSNLDLPGAMGYYSKTLSLPLFPAMDNEDVTKVVDALKKVLKI